MWEHSATGRGVWPANTGEEHTRLLGKWNIKAFTFASFVVTLIATHYNHSCIGDVTKSSQAHPQTHLEQNLSKFILILPVASVIQLLIYF